MVARPHRIVFGVPRSTLGSVWCPPKDAHMIPRWIDFAILAITWLDVGLGVALFVERGAHDAAMD